MTKQYIVTLALSTDPDGIQRDEIKNRIADSVRWLGFVDDIDIWEVHAETVPDSTGYSR